MSPVGVPWCVTSIFYPVTRQEHFVLLKLRDVAISRCDRFASIAVGQIYSPLKRWAFVSTPVVGTLRLKLSALVRWSTTREDGTSPLTWDGGSSSPSMFVRWSWAGSSSMFVGLVELGNYSSLRSGTSASIEPTFTPLLFVVHVIGGSASSFLAYVHIKWPSILGRC